MNTVVNTIATIWPTTPPPDKIVNPVHTYTWDYSLKVILLGESAVGKTSFSRQFIDQKFANTYSSTIGIEYGTKYLSIPGVAALKLHIWDTAGAEAYHSIAKSYYRDTAGILLMYDITDRESFDAAKTWYNEVICNVDSDTPIILIGNKLDLVEYKGAERKRKVPKDEAEMYAANNGLHFMECTAKSYSSVEDAFIELSKAIHKNIENHIRMYGTNHLPRGVKSPHYITDAINKVNRETSTPNTFTRKPIAEELDTESCCIIA